ncbi:MAG TPA: nucleoside triphosphate pyrophosphohydrolase [Candidatus Kapabacteria bacterium]|nr:nucleoside triphosphate pyrophosphohydrolase [Candidatus Kapabacteria bacterium]
MNPPTETFEDFFAIVRRLRVDCPWDREQTHASIAPLLVEEAYEVKESIEDGNDDELKKELGDILLHAVMHSVIAEERGAFNFDDVVQQISRKLVHRHPHVFGDENVHSAEQVSQNWEQLKMKEGRTSLFDNMPRALPALQRADRVQEKASKVGFDWEEPEDVWAKVEEEIAELREAQQGGRKEDVEEEFGDLLFALVNYARFIAVAPEESLQRTTNKFIRRFQHIEARLAASGRTFKEADLEEMERYWNEAKELERGRPGSH